jgi:hypothetical protein
VTDNIGLRAADMQMPVFERGTWEKPPSKRQYANGFGGRF